MALRIAYFPFVVATLLFAPSAFAQTDAPPPMEREPGMAPPPPSAGAAFARFRAACGPDFVRFCRGIPPGGGRVVDCLLRHRPALTLACETEMAALVGPRPGPPPMEPPPGPASAPPGAAPMAPPPGAPAGGERAAFAAACGADVRALCAGVPPQNRGIIKCLVAHRAEVSEPCKTYLLQARAARAGHAPEGAPPIADPGSPPPANAPMPPASSSPPGPPAANENPPPRSAPANE
jgi:hypothetical protein